MRGFRVRSWGARFRRAIALFLLVLLVILYPTVIEPRWIQVSTLELTLPHLSPAFDRYRLVHISDIHADSWMTAQRLQRLVRRINQLQPDAIAITGDLVTTEPETFAPVLLELGQLDSQDGVFAVLGNHDYVNDPTPIRRYLEQARVVLLRNETKTLTRNQQQLTIAGVDDVWFGKDDLAQVLTQLPKSQGNLLLVHEPDFADQSAASLAFDLQLSGHSHGGQIKLPFMGAPYLPPFGRLYPYGLYQINQMWEYTNRGMGMVRPRVRFNARPEITVLTLHAPMGNRDGNDHHNSLEPNTKKRAGLSSLFLKY